MNDFWSLTDSWIAEFRIHLLCSMENNIFIFEQTIPLNHHATDLIVLIVNYRRKTQKALTKVNKQCNEHLVVTIHFKRITGNFVHTRKKIKYIFVSLTQFTQLNMQIWWCSNDTCTNHNLKRLEIMRNTGEKQSSSQATTHLIFWQLTWGKQDKVVQDKKSISLTPWLALKIFWATDYMQVKTRSGITFNQKRRWYGLSFFGRDGFDIVTVCLGVFYFFRIFFMIQ